MSVSVAIIHSITKACASWRPDRSPDREAVLYRTVGIKDAAVERTGTYSQGESPSGERGALGHKVNRRQAREGALGRSVSGKELPPCPGNSSICHSHSIVNELGMHCIFNTLIIVICIDTMKNTMFRIYC